MKRTSLAMMMMLVAGAGSAQTFSLDDNPSAPLTSAFYPGLFSAEDPFGLFLPATAAGLIAPSPTLLPALFGAAYVDGDLLTVVPAIPIAPVPDIGRVAGSYLNAVSADHEQYDVDHAPEMNMRFSVDRAGRGLPGTALAVEAGFSQQPGDIYISEKLFPNPGNFVGTLGAGPFAGFLATAAPIAGINFLDVDESGLNLTPGLGAGAFLPPAVLAPPIAPGTHDNVDAYNVLPNPTLDIDGDGVTDIDVFMSMPPGNAAALGFSSADLIAVPKGAPGIVPPAWAVAPMLGLNMLGFPPNSQLDNQLDDVDGLVVWDIGELSPNAALRAEPNRDYALFSLSETSASLSALRSAGFPVDGSTIFFTDFSGAFAVYLFGSQVGIADFSFNDQQISNLDALEICAELVQPCDPCERADVNGDGVVNAADFGAWIAAFNAGLPAADQNCDGIINAADFGAWIANFNMCA